MMRYVPGSSTKFSNFRDGIASMTLKRIPIYGTVRIILTPGCKSTYANDGVKEFNMIDVQNDPSLIIVLESIGKT